MSIRNNSEVIDQSAAINQIPHQPGLIGSLGVFRTQRVGTDTITFDVRQNSFHVLEDHLRNVSARNALPPQSYEIHTLPIPHYPIEGVVTRQQLAGIKAFGKEAEETVAAAVATELERQSELHDYHLEYLQSCMLLTGEIATTWYSTINAAAEFGVSRPSEAVDMLNALAGIRSAQQKAKAGLTNGGVVRGYVVLAGVDWFEAFIQSADVKTAYQFSQAGNNPLRLELGTVANGYTMFRMGNTDFVLYDDTFTLKDGSTVKPLADAEAVMVPRTVLGSTFFGPASTLSGLGSIGSKRFAQSYRDPKDRYVEVSSEQNTLVLLENFGSTVLLTIDA